MNSLEKRIEWVLATHEEFDGKITWWCREAGVNHSQLGTMLKRLAKSDADMAAGKKRRYAPTTLTIVKLSEAAHVSPGWLAFGTGSPNDGMPLSDARFPNRATAITMAQLAANEFLPEAIAEVERTSLPSGDESVRWWFEQIVRCDKTRRLQIDRELAQQQELMEKAGSRLPHPPSDSHQIASDHRRAR